MRDTHKNLLSRRKRYLQVALNSTIEDARAILAQLPDDERIIIEAGTPLIKRYGISIIRELLGYSLIDALSGRVGKRRYVVADLKTIDRGDTEAALAASAGASAAIAMGSAPKETLDTFIASCHAHGMDAMIDMMNVEYPLTVLRALKTPPDVVVLHRGVDEERDNREKMLPLHEIRRIKGAMDVMIAVAGGDTPREVQSAAFNDADIVIVWKSVYELNEKTLELVEGFLKTIK